MSVARPLVAVIDDDDSIRESLPDLLRQLGYGVSAFASAEAFLASSDLSRTKCLILDIAMPGMSGLDLQRELKVRSVAIPIVFISGQGDEGLRLRTFGEGAIRFLLKPFSDTSLREALAAAFRAEGSNIS